jgi:hypothetical protein
MISSQLFAFCFLLTISYLLLPPYVFRSKMLQKRAVVMVFLGFAGNGSGGGFWVW